MLLPAGVAGSAAFVSSRVPAALARLPTRAALALAREREREREAEALVQETALT